MEQAKKKLAASAMMMLIAFLSLCTASYAWFNIATHPVVSNLALTLIEECGLELAPDVGGSPGEWASYLDLTSALADVVPLKPVTFLSSERGFFAPGYYGDGRPSYSSGKRLSDSENASVKGSPENGYYIAYSFWMRSNTMDSIIELADSMENSNGEVGQGTFLIGKAKDEAGVASEAAIRMGFRIMDADENGNIGAEERFIVYEPNADVHIADDFESTETLNVDGGSYVAEEDHFIQNASTFSGAVGVGASVNPGSFQTENLEMFTLKEGGMKKITLYIWLEGQDVDCNNSSMDVELYGNIQFDTKITREGGPIIQAR